MATASHPKATSPLVEAAAALDEELRAYDDLAAEATHAPMNSEKGLQRAIKIVQDSAGRNERIQDKLKGLVSEIELARTRQVESLNALLEAARAVETRAQQHDGMMQRFAALGESAKQVNSMTSALSERRQAGASESELLEGLNGIQIQMATVVAEAEALTTLATEQDWPEFARQADAVRQQVLAAKNKLVLAHRSMATRAPS
jgi:glutamine synthetase adenylyltransferase